MTIICQTYDGEIKQINFNEEIDDFVEDLNTFEKIYSWDKYEDIKILKIENDNYRSIPKIFQKT